ncbi:hypothetical protein QTG54_013908 [Skeletonema marinoi]|uniref:Uncharacterized protein n=1 Tax=Skeletonema marinoi TaxID=267567 RepID=A0AAD8XWP2_9STRA|nr:hypothetical protein QTG54_013908 [Skeletonema marinoi]
MEATSAAAEAESTVTSLRSVIEELRRDNESLHWIIEGSYTNLERRINDSSKQGHLKSVAKMPRLLHPRRMLLLLRRMHQILELSSFGSKEHPPLELELKKETSASMCRSSKERAAEEPPDSYSRQLTYSSTKSHQENDSNKSDLSSRKTSALRRRSLTFAAFAIARVG